MFYRMEQLSKLQIQGFFLQLSEEGKKSDGKETSRDARESQCSHTIWNRCQAVSDAWCLQPLQIGIWKQTFIFQGYDAQGNV